MQKFYNELATPALWLILLIVMSLLHAKGKFTNRRLDALAHCLCCERRASLLHS